MDESLPQPMAPPPRPRPKPVHKNNSLSAATNKSQMGDSIPDAWPSNSSTISNNSNVNNNISASGNSYVNRNNVSDNNVTDSSNVVETDEQSEIDELEAERRKVYIEDSIEHDEKGEACEWHLAAMLDGTYLDPYSVPAKYLIQQEFERIKTVANEFQHLLEENKKRHDKNLKQKPE